MPKDFIEFERGDRVRIRGGRVEYTVVRLDYRGSPKYDPSTTDAYISGSGVEMMIPVSALELAV